MKDKVRHTRGDRSLRLVPAILKSPLKSLHEGTGDGDFHFSPTNSSHEVFWGKSRWDLSQKFKPVWIRGTCARTKVELWTGHFCLRLDSHRKNGQSTRWALPPRLVAATSCVPTSTKTIKKPRFDGWFDEVWEGRNFHYLKVLGTSYP